jgi:hypothetical protein
MGNNKWAPAIHHYREIKPTSGAPLRMSSTVEPLITTAYPKFAMHDLAEAKQIIEVYRYFQNRQCSWIVLARFGTEADQGDAYAALCPIRLTVESSRQRASGGCEAAPA